MTAQINLYHDRFRKAHLLLPFSRMVIIVGFASLIVPAMIAYNSVETRHIQSYSLRLQQQFAHMQSELQIINKSLVNKQGDKALANEISKLEFIQTHRSELMRQINEHGLVQQQRYSDYLIALARQHIKNIWLSKISISRNGADLNIEGKTNDAVALPDYLKRLANEPVLTGKHLDIMRINKDRSTSTDTGPMEFVIASRRDDQ